MGEARYVYGSWQNKTVIRGRLGRTVLRMIGRFLAYPKRCSLGINADGNMPLHLEKRHFNSVCVCVCMCACVCKLQKQILHSQSGSQQINQSINQSINQTRRTWSLSVCITLISSVKHCNCALTFSWLDCNCCHDDCSCTSTSVTH